MGRLKHPFQELYVFYIPSFKVNIISEFHLRQFFTLEFLNSSDPENDSMVATNIKSGTKVHFQRNTNNIFRVKIPVMHITVTEVKIKYTKEQIKYMQRVHELHRRTGYLSLDKLSLMIRNNVIHGQFDQGTITVQDVKNYADSLHQLLCKGCALGKTQNEPALPLDNVETAHECNTAHMDVMHVTYGRQRKLNYLVSKDRYSSFLIVRQIQSLDLDDINSAMEEIENTYFRHQHKLQHVHLYCSNKDDRFRRKQRRTREHCSLFRAKTSLVACSSCDIYIYMCV